MSIIQYSDGTKIEFSGSPTQEDVENAYNQVKGITSAPMARVDTSTMARSRNVPDKNAPGGYTQEFLNEKTGTYVPMSEATISQKAKGLAETFVDPAITFIKSAIAAPIDIARSIVGKSPIDTTSTLPSGKTGTSIQQQAQDVTSNVFKGTTTPFEGTINLVGQTIEGAGGILGAADLAGTSISKLGKVNPPTNILSDIKNSLLNRIGGKTSEQILATAEKDVPKLTADAQKIWYKNKAAILAEEASKAADAAKLATEQGITEVKANISKFQQELGSINRDTAIALKKPAQQLMKDSSATYIELTGEAADGSPALAKKIPVKNIINDIDSKFEYSPEIAQSLKNNLSITDETATLTNQEILNKAREIMSNVSKTAKAGNRVYTPAEYQAIQEYSFLMEQLNKNGVDMTKANEFWKAWAPVRDRIVREIKPFEETNIGKMPITSTLQTAESTANTARQAAAKLDAQNFISELENRLKLPTGSIGSETRLALEKVEKAKLNKDTLEKASKEILDAIKADKKKALLNMSLKAYDTERTARTRKIIRRVLIGLGIFGAAKATGLDRAVLTGVSSVI